MVLMIVLMLLTVLYSTGWKMQTYTDWDVTSVNVLWEFSATYEDCA